MNYNFDLNVLVGAAATIVGTLIGGAITLITTKREGKLAALKDTNLQISHDLLRASEQVAAYHALEAEYAGDIAEQRGVGAKTIKTEYRNRVEARGYVRPTWTEDKAREAFEAAADGTSS